MNSPSHPSPCLPFEDGGEFLASSGRGQAPQSQRRLFGRVQQQLLSYVKASGHVADSCFISHAHGIKAQEDWVIRKFAPDLKGSGVPVVVDRLHDTLGRSMPHFINQIMTLDRVLVVGTPLFQEKARPKSGHVVAREMEWIVSRIRQDDRAVIPVLQAGSEKSSFPETLWDRIYVDLRDEDRYHENVFDLILHLYGVIEHESVQEWRQRLQDNSQVWMGPDNGSPW